MSEGNGCIVLHVTVIVIDVVLANKYTDMAVHVHVVIAVHVRPHTVLHVTDNYYT